MQAEGWRARLQAGDPSPVLDDAGKLIGYSSVSSGDASLINTWVEPSLQVWRDVKQGHRYFVRVSETEIARAADPSETTRCPPPMPPGPTT